LITVGCAGGAGDATLSRPEGLVLYTRDLPRGYMPYCYGCAHPSGSNPYNAIEAMEIVVRALRIRPRR
jgi:hypothetical protein